MTCFSFRIFILRLNSVRVPGSLAGQLTGCFMGLQCLLGGGHYKPLPSSPLLLLSLTVSSCTPRRTCGIWGSLPAFWLCHILLPLPTWRAPGAFNSGSRLPSDLPAIACSGPAPPSIPVLHEEPLLHTTPPCPMGVLGLLWAPGKDLCVLFLQVFPCLGASEMFVGIRAQIQVWRPATVNLKFAFKAQRLQAEEAPGSGARTAHLAALPACSGPPLTRCRAALLPSCHPAPFSRNTKPTCGWIYR